MREGNGFLPVEVPESSVDTVIEAVAGAKIRGGRVSARRERSDAPRGRRARGA